MNKEEVFIWRCLLWLQQLEKGLKKQRQPCVNAVLSARVGSISDNQLGGWHSYRFGVTIPKAFGF